MRFTISREKLQEGLAAVTAAVPAKTTLPVLANLLVETTERGIRLSATDLDIAVSTEVSADVESAGSITIPAKPFNLTGRSVLFTPTSSGYSVTAGLSAYDRNFGTKLNLTLAPAVNPKLTTTPGVEAGDDAYMSNRSALALTFMARPIPA